MMASKSKTGTGTSSKMLAAAKQRSDKANLIGLSPSIAGQSEYHLDVENSMEQSEQMSFLSPSLESSMTHKHAQKHVYHAVSKAGEQTDDGNNNQGHSSASARTASRKATQKHGGSTSVGTPRQVEISSPQILVSNSFESVRTKHQQTNSLSDGRTLHTGTYLDARSRDETSSGFSRDTRTQKQYPDTRGEHQHLRLPPLNTGYPQGDSSTTSGSVSGRGSPSGISQDSLTMQDSDGNSTEEPEVDDKQRLLFETASMLLKAPDLSLSQGLSVTDMRKKPRSLSDSVLQAAGEKPRIFVTKKTKELVIKLPNGELLRGRCFHPAVLRSFCSCVNDSKMQVSSA